MKIVYEKGKCIGCGSCETICPKYWKLNEEGKADLIGSANQPNGDQELIIKEIACNKDAADSCPVECIKIVDE